MGPVGVIHVDAHCDVNEHMNNCAIAHGTVFRRALEDGCLDAKRVVQIGLRGSGHSIEDYAWPISQVFLLVPLFVVFLPCRASESDPSQTFADLSSEFDVLF